MMTIRDVMTMSVLTVRPDMPLKDVAPGLYVLRVLGRSRVSDQVEASRETIIRVLEPPAR